MSRRHGPAAERGLPGRLARRGAALGRLKVSSVGDTYPDKYLRKGWQQKRTARGPGTRRGVVISTHLLFAAAIWTLISISIERGGDSTGFDTQVAVRAVGYSLAAVWVLFVLGRRKLPFDRWMFVWALVPVFIALTSLYAPERFFTLSAGLAHLALLLFAWNMVARHGQVQAVFAVVIAGTLICALSIFAYFAFPEVGRSTVDVLHADPGGRMRGVTAQANTLGSISALTMLLAITHFRALTLLQRGAVAVAIALAAVCLLSSQSRAATLAMMLCVGMWWFYRTNTAFNLFGIVALTLGACLIMTFVPDVTVYLAREGGRSDDLASFNGRWEIWEVAWGEIQANPFLGQGYGASREILDSARDRLFAAAVNTHNVYLELLFSGGVVLLGLYAIALSLSIIRSVRFGRPEALVAVMFFIIIGVTDSSPFSGLPLFAAATFYTAVALCLAPPVKGRQMPSQPSQAPMGRGRVVIAPTGPAALGPQR